MCVIDEKLSDGTAAQLVAALRADPETAGIAFVVVAPPGCSEKELALLRRDVFAVATKGEFTADDWVVTVKAAAGIRVDATPQVLAVKPDSGPLVLIADDNDLNRQLLRRLLQRMNLQVAVARDGSEALTMAKKQPPQLLLLDLAMPVMDGHATLLALRQDPALAHIPAIAVTALAMRADEERALRVGFAAVVSKPIDFERLQSVVREMLARGGGETAEASA